MASENTLLDKLEAIRIRFEETAQQITDPEVIADVKRFVKLNKEYKHLEPLVEVYKNYKKLISNIEEAREILNNEKDEEMREMAKMELDENEPKIAPMEEDIKLLLLPSDPEDDKNAILEIRGGTGGDEAALFAGDLFRMYTKYCEAKGWNWKYQAAAKVQAEDSRRLSPA